MTCGIIKPESARQAALESVAHKNGDSLHLGVIECWTLDRPIPGFPRLIVGSTYARRTLEEALFPESKVT